MAPLCCPFPASWAGSPVDGRRPCLRAVDVTRSGAETVAQGTGRPLVSRAAVRHRQLGVVSIASLSLCLQQTSRFASGRGCDA